MIPFPEIRAVTFDVGGTLMAPWPSVGAVYAGAAARHGVKNLSAEILNRQFDEIWRAKRNFDHSRGAWKKLVTATFVGLLKPSEILFQDLYQTFAEPESWRIFDDVRPALERLTQRGLKLGVISNWDERLRPLLHVMGLAHFFSVIVISCEFGCAKPSPAIFQRAAELLELPARSVLHVGDSRKDDLQGAQVVGMAGLVVQRNGITEDEEISSLQELALRLKPD